MRYAVKVNGFEKEFTFLDKNEAITYAKSLIAGKCKCVYRYKTDCSVLEVTGLQGKKIMVVPIMNRGYGTISEKPIWSYIRK